VSVTKFNPPGTGKEAKTRTGHTEGVFVVAWNPDGKRLASGSNKTEKTIRIWDVESGRLIRSISEEDSGSYSLAWSPNGKRLATGDVWVDGGTSYEYFSLWNAETWELIRSIESGTIPSLAFTPDGRRIAATSNYSDAHFIRVYDALYRGRTVG
jgi:WD40 repeat protein